jgi:ribosomal protein S18 acetylase RimI-like enzyme
VVDELDAGFLWVNEHEAETVLVSIRLLPRFQNKGIGTKIIREILDSSKNPVRLQVLKVNPALNLYKRLGFKVFAENETHFSMRT